MITKPGRYFAHGSGVLGALWPLHAILAAYEIDILFVWNDDLRIWFRVISDKTAVQADGALICGGRRKCLIVFWTSSCNILRSDLAKLFLAQFSTLPLRVARHQLFYPAAPRLAAHIVSARAGVCAIPGRRLVKTYR